MEIVSYCTKNGRMSRKLVSGIHFHHQVMSDDNDDIQDPRYHMSRQIFLRVLYVGLHGPGWLYVLGMPPRGYLRL